MSLVQRSRAWWAALILWPLAGQAVDLAALWDFARPEVSEQRFRAALEKANGDDALILQTQIARSHGLRRDFATARAVLAALEPAMPTAGPEAQVRYQLELGSHRCVGHPRCRADHPRSCGPGQGRLWAGPASGQGIGPGRIGD
jgi:hypothetical protein